MHYSMCRVVVGLYFIRPLNLGEGAILYMRTKLGGGGGGKMVLNICLNVPYYIGKNNNVTVLWLYTFVVYNNNISDSFIKTHVL